MPAIDLNSGYHQNDEYKIREPAEEVSCQDEEESLAYELHGQVGLLESLVLEHVPVELHLLVVDAHLADALTHPEDDAREAQHARHHRQEVHLVAEKGIRD